MQTNNNLFNWHRVPIGKAVRLWLLPLLMCFGASMEVNAAMDPYGSVSRQLTWGEPWGEFYFRFYNATSPHSFYLHDAGDGVNKGPALYVDGTWVCSPDWELAWPGSNGAGNQDGIEDERGHNGWWGNTYKQTVNGRSYEIHFWDPGRTNNTYGVYVVPYIREVELDKSHTVSIKGWWRTNGQGTWLLTRSFTFNALSSNLSAPTGVKMTDYNHFTISGNIHSEYGPTWVGTTNSATGNSYIAPGSMTTSTRYDKGRSSYSNQSLTIERSDYYNRITKPVEYVIERAIGGDRGTFYLYKWFNVSIPGFVRAKDLQTEADIWNRKITVKWGSDESDSRCKEGTWRIYRSQKGADDWTLLTSTDLPYGQRQYVNEDANLAYDQEYEYKVVFIPKNSPAGWERSELSQTVTGILQRSFSFTNLTATSNLEDKIVFSWNHTAFENASSHAYPLIVQRSTSDPTLPDDQKVWVDVKNYQINSKSTTEGSYEDIQELQSFQSYSYRLKTTVFDKDYTSESVTGYLAGMSYVTDFAATRGTYSSMVKLKWTAKQIGTALTYYDVQRRPLGSVDEDDWITLATISGTATSYSYDDVTALSGSYCQYRLITWTMYNDQRMGNIKTQTDGFSVATGVISGRLTYGTGTAVEGARVMLKANNSEGEIVNPMRSLKFSGTKSGMTYHTTGKGVKQLFGKDFSVQLYVSPSMNEMGEDGTSYNLFDVAGVFGMTMTYDAANDQYLLGAKIGDNANTTALAIPRGVWRHLTCVHNSTTQTTTFYVTKGGELQQAAVFTDQNLDAGDGNAQEDAKVNLAYLTDYTQPTFKGYVDEFRFFTRALSEKDILRNYNHPLAGSETGLAIYWPMDEGIEGQTIAYDFSKTNNVGNGRHGIADLAAISSTYLPEPEELSLMAYSNEQGTYEIRGVPFSGDGTSYTIVPTMDNHEFSPAYLSRFINMSALNHSAVDFEDISSFTVSGTILYAGTNIPVDSVQLSVDGRTASRNNEIVMTDENGDFTIDVPIGRHYISASKDGHTFVQNGRIPEDPTGLNETTIEIKNPLSGLLFYDNTLVPVAGRVVGGTVEGEKPLGFGLSKNTIGKAVITLEIPDTRYMINAYEDTEGLVSNGYMPVAKDSVLTYPKGAVSTGLGYRTGGNLEENAKNIVITTDGETGEFAVLLPPLDYKVTSVVMENAQARAAYTFNAEQLPRINASDATTVLQDSIPNEEGGYTYFDYVASFNQTLHTQPILSVSQEGAPEGAFGNAQGSYEVPTTGKTEYVPLYTVDGNDVTYKFNYPIFTEMADYTFNLEGYELYTNFEREESDEERVSKVPLKDVVVTISNALSASQKVYSAAPANGENAGKVVDLKENQLQLNNEGKATYKWKAGLPNIQDEFTRTLNMTYNNGAGENSWQGLEGIIFGDLPTGTNFTTKGPSEVDMVLHDPYGDSSFATWESGKVTVTSTETLKTQVSEQSTMANMHMGPKLELEEGLFVSIQTEIEVIADVSAGATITEQHDTIDTYVTTIETTQAISTSADPDMIGADADIYIGKSTNLLFGQATSVGLKLDKTGVPVVAVSDAITVGKEFDTNFLYTQYQIENVVIPNLRTVRNSLLKPVPDMANAKNETDKTIYVTELDDKDENFGEPGTYRVLAKEPGIDMVSYYNEEIRNWQERIGESENYKLELFKDANNVEKKNISFGGGVEYTESESKSTTVANSVTYTHMNLGTVFFDLGGMLNGVGLDIAHEEVTSHAGDGAETNSSEETSTTTFSYTLADSGADDSFTMNVYKPSGNHGPVFRTLGGQTSAPYEGQEVTKYYRPGTELSAATVQIEMPELTCKNNQLTGVPTGGKAQFELKLRNFSPTKTDCYFKLVPVDGSNKKGARLSLPTGELGEGHTVLVPADEAVTLILTLEQGNLDVTDYTDIQLALVSTSQYDATTIHGAISSTVSLSAHFVPASTPVNMTIDHLVVNTNNVDNDLAIRVTDFDRHFAGLQRIDLQYMAPGSQSWNLLKSYIPDATVRTDNSQILLPENGVIEMALNMKPSSWIDGTYKFRAQSSAIYSGKLVTSESEVLTLVKDVSRPQPFGIANPSDGVLNSDDEISLTFNEDIQKNILTDNNIIVSGVLNEAKIHHDVALSAQGTDCAAYTEAEINLAQKDFSSDMWVRVTDAGDILAHGNGEEKFKVSVDANDHIVVTIGSESYISTNTIEKNVWTFLAFAYSYEQGNSQLNVRAVSDSGTNDLFRNEVVADYSGTGSLTLGQNFSGAIHGLSLWDKTRDMEEAQSEMYQTKKPSAPHLIGYWKMDEGDGSVATDYARNRHMTLSNKNGWYLNNDNKAVSLDGTNPLKINISGCPVRYTEDYAVEMWFKGEQAAQRAASTLFYVSDESIGMGFDGDGALTLMAKGTDIEVSKKNYLDNAWHHLALNVLRNGNATVYVDGTAVKTLSASVVPTLAGAYLYIGARAINQPFIGAVDEVRVWNATMTGELLKSQSKQRLTGEESGLVAYYSFEQMSRDANSGMISSVSSARDLCTGTLMATTVLEETPVAYSDEAPALKVKPEATNVPYNYVANERGIIITLNDEPARLEGTTLLFTVKGVKDMIGNEGMPVMWTAFVKQNQLTWKGETEVKVRKQGVESVNFEATFVNDSGDTENWSLSGLPAWLTASAVGGTLKAQLAKTITFTVAKSLPIGTYETTVYLTGSQGIATPLNVTVTSEGQVPLWSVNPRDFENSMNVIGQVKLEDRFMNDEGDMLAAFIGDECRGVAHLQYKPRYDGYFVTMDIYDNGEGDEKKEVTFRAYDASTGTVYPAVEPDQPVKFESLALIGKYDAPVVFDVLDKVEQSTELKAGWNWLSLNVTKDKMDVKTLFENIAEDVDIVKSQYDGWLMCEDGEWDGSLTADLRNEQMYAVRMLNDRTLRIVGKRVSPDDCPISVYQGWNWVGYYGRQTASVDDAMAGMQPVNGDILKAQSGVAYFDDTEWAGSIEVMEPGKGYMVNVNTPRTFGYPKASVAGARSLSVEEGDLVTADHGSFTPVDFRNYAGNAIMAAKIVAAGKPVTNAELGVFADGECRAAAMTNEKGVAYLTIPGDDAAVLTFKVAVDDKEAEAAESVAYEVDGVYGSPKHPFVIDLSGATEIEMVASDDERVEIYDLQGRKVTSENARLNKGVYIVNGRKQVVK